MTRLSQLQATERHILESAGVLEDCGDYVVVRSERFPSWYQANMIELRRPGGRSLVAWEQVFRAHFDPKTHRHTMIYIPDPARFERLVAESEAVLEAESSEVVACPLRVQSISYMLATDTSRCRPLPEGFEVRPVETEAGWDNLYEFSLAEAREEPWFRDESAFREFFETRRLISEEIDVTWLRLLREGDRKILSRLGIFDHAQVCRLQSVGTVSEHRRQGLGSALVAHAIRLAIDDRQAEGLALSVEADSPAHAMYASLGFEPVGSEYWLMRYPSAE
jgi:GNAT superfamily N-acetyltransferase